MMKVKVNEIFSHLLKGGGSYNCYKISLPKGREIFVIGWGYLSDDREYCWRALASEPKPIFYNGEFVDYSSPEGSLIGFVHSLGELEELLKKELAVSEETAKEICDELWEVQISHNRH